MNTFFGYVRVSTAKQGERGTSLQEQRDAITHYAQRNGLILAEWFEERETAAKQGRPVFSRMLSLLKRRQAGGVIMHKIDRGARNFKDWANLQELFDGGVDVRFANESIDLRSRGGRLSADIQAVVAADYIRNLREETRKGFYGRLKQGVYPLPAPLGYLDQGKGQPKAVDPTRGPLVRKAFQLYAAGGYSLESLRAELHRLGLRNNRGHALTRNGLSIMLNNPFYTGIIRVRRTGEVFQGRHDPLVSQRLFSQVQTVLRGKLVLRRVRHAFRFRRLLKCKRCGRSLIGETQKGHVYYRCQTRDCPTTCVREERVEQLLLDLLRRMMFSKPEEQYLRSEVERQKHDWREERENRTRALGLQLRQIEDRLVRLTDAYLDGVLEKELFEQRKTAFIQERLKGKEELDAWQTGKTSFAEQLQKILELAGTAYSLYEKGISEEKRELVQIVTSNLEVDRKTLDFKLAEPFSIIANRATVTSGGPYRDTTRTFVKKLVLWIKQG